MHKIKKRTAPSSFLEKFEPSHPYLTQIKLGECRFDISIGGPAIWNGLVESTLKEIQSTSLFQTKIKKNYLILTMR